MLYFPCKFNFNGVQALNFIHKFRQLLLYSTSTSSSSSSSSSSSNLSSSFSKYLVNSLGISEQQSLSTLAKLSHMRKLRGTKNLTAELTAVKNADSVINFFKQHGFHLSQIRNAVISAPVILFSNVDKTLKPKFQLLNDVGLCGPDLVHVISKNPFLLMRQLIPVIQVLRNVLGSNENVVNVIKQSNLLYSSFGKENLVMNVKLLQEYGIDIERIRKHMLLKSRPFLLRTESLRDLLVRVENKLGVPRHSGMFLYGVQLVSGASDRVIESKFKVFESFGWKNSDVVALVRQNPLCLTSSEARIKKSLEFFVNELGCDPACLVSNCTLLTSSLEKRLVPRYRVLQVLKEKGLLRADYSPFRAMTLTEPKFLEKFVQPFKDDAPCVHEIYAASKDLHKVPETTMGKSL